MNRIIYMDMPVKIRGGLRKIFDESTGEDYYIIALNSRHTWETLQLTKLHEAKHLEMHDLDPPCWRVDLLEYERHENRPGGNQSDHDERMM